VKNNTKLDQRIASILANFSIKYWYLVVLIVVSIGVGISSGASRLAFTPDYRVFFSGENPDLTIFLDFQKTYSKNDNFYFVIKPKDSNVFTQKNLSAIEELTKRAWNIPYSNRVDSLTNFQYTYAVGDNLTVEDLVYDAHNLSNIDLSIKKNIALSEPLLNGLFITNDATATAINVVLQLPGKTVYEVPKAASEARKIVSEITKKYPNLDIYLTGFGMLNNAFGESGYMDSIKLVPVMYIVLMIASLLILRSFVGTFITIIVAYLSMGVGMGLGGFFGVPLTPVSNSAPIIIITLAIANSIHLFKSFQSSIRDGHNKFEAIEYSIVSNFLPITITTLTTVVGFLSLNFSDSPPFSHLGNMSAAGIIAAWFISLTLFPAFLCIFPVIKPNVLSKGIKETISNRMAMFVGENSKKILMTTFFILTGLFIALPSLQFDDQWSDYFDKSIKFRTDTDAATKFFGLYPIEYSIPSGKSHGVSNPEYLKYVDSFVNFAKQQDNVNHVYSIVEIIRRLNMNLNSDNRKFYKIPDSSELTSDYLLLYEMSLPYGLSLNDRINIDKSSSRVTVMLGKTSTTETKAFLNSMKTWIKENLPENMQKIRPTSAHVMFTYITDRNVKSMIVGTILAVLLIGLILWVSLGSFKMGLISLLTNGLPIIAAFGCWSLIVGTVGFSVASVASISLGIVVDDTVHFLTKYFRLKSDFKLTPVDAISETYKSVGSALIGSTIIIACGLIVLSSSTFKINEDLGLLTLLAISIALVFDFLVLPAFLVILDFRNTNTNTISEEESLPIKSSSTKLAAKSAALLLVGISLAAGFSPETFADTNNLTKGLEVSARSDRSDRGFEDSITLVTMTLHNTKGEQAKRVMEFKTLEVQNESVGDKSVVVFQYPIDISGTSLLSHAKILDQDDQWLYLNSMKRIKRISSKNKSGPFMGSEFAFEDLTSQELNKYTYKWLELEPCGGFICDVVERTPLYQFSGYSSQKVWIDQDIYQLRKIEYYDRKNDLLKTLIFSDYRGDKGIWRSHLWEMTNHQTKNKTELNFDKFSFHNGLTSVDFSKSRLRGAD
jgi:predicted RND superfamily exporter protein/outer membrane lipoprotein-sorting protein